MAESLTVTRVTHSCHLIEIGGHTLLTDPWFSQRAAYHPGEPIALTVGQLPRLDGVLITHHHYDHCDLDQFRAYRDKDVPLVVADPVVPRARKAGFGNVQALRPWQQARLGDLTVTAAPAKHKVYEVTFVIQGGGRTVYFAGDTMLIPELDELPARFPDIDLALVPTNGLQLRPLLNQQVVMNAEQAATLTARLRPQIAVPHHYAFTSGRLGDLLITKSDRDPASFVRAANRLAPDTEVRVLRPGEPLAA